jgi:hypothetical protein
VLGPKIHRVIADFRHVRSRRVDSGKDQERLTQSTQRRKERSQRKAY